MKVTYTVVCAMNNTHKFSVVYEIEPNTDFETSESTELCPFCGVPVQVTIQGKIENEDIFRFTGPDGK